MDFNDELPSFAQTDKSKNNWAIIASLDTSQRRTLKATDDTDAEKREEIVLDKKTGKEVRPCQAYPVLIGHDTHVQCATFG